MSRLLSLQDVSFTYPSSSKAVLSNLSFSISKGEWVAVGGQNGSGKSTLARLLSGQFSPSSGVLMLDGVNLSDPEGQRAQRKQCGYVFQNPDHQFVGATVWDDMAFGLENYSVSREDMLDRINEYANLLNLVDLLDKAPHQLSGGQKQRAALAGVMVLEPNLIILDEATSMLDPQGRLGVLQALETIRKQGVTIIMITHDMEEAYLAERLIVLHEGTIVADARPEQVFEQREIVQKAALALPFVVEVQQWLAQAGIQLDLRCRNEEELVEQICNYHLIT